MWPPPPAKELDQPGVPRADLPWSHLGGLPTSNQEPEETHNYSRRAPPPMTTGSTPPRERAELPPPVGWNRAPGALARQQKVVATPGPPKNSKAGLPGTPWDSALGTWDEMNQRVAGLLHQVKAPLSEKEARESSNLPLPSWELMATFYLHYPGAAPIIEEAAKGENGLTELATLLGRSVIFDAKIFPRAVPEVWLPWLQWKEESRTQWRNQATRILCAMENDLREAGIPPPLRRLPLQEMLVKVNHIFKMALRQPPQPERAAWTGSPLVDLRLQEAVGRQQVHVCDVNLDGIQNTLPVFGSLHRELLPDIVSRAAAALSPTGPLEDALDLSGITSSSSERTIPGPNSWENLTSV